MEENTPSLTAPESEPTSTSQTTPTQPQIAKKNFPVTFILLGIAAVVLVAVSVGATYVVMSKKATSNTPPPTGENVAIPLQPTPTMSKQVSNLNTFTDENIQGMTFQYDVDKWDITKINDKNIDLVPEGFNKYFGSSGVLMKEKNSDGVLFMKYGYTVGRGGAMGTFYANEYKKLSSISRIKYHDKNMYIYGLDNQKTRTIFTETPEEKKNYEQFCEEGYEGQGAFDEQTCDDIANGKIIGIYADPSYAWSLELKRLADAKEIWGVDDYLDDEQPENVMIETQYSGHNPQLADEIVTQLFE